MIGGSLIIVGVYLVIWGQGGDDDDDDPKPFHSIIISRKDEDEDEDEDQEEQSPQQSCIKILDTSSITNPDSDHHHHGHKTTNNYISETIRNYVSISSHHSNNPTAKEHRSHHVPAITQPLLAASTNAVLMDGDQTS